MRKAFRNINGFTLIELLITVVIIGILAAIAVPSYQNYVRESRRTEAQSTLLELQMGMERYRAANNAYSTSVSTVCGDSCDNTSYYSYSISASGETYVLEADPQGSQTSDTANGATCDPLRLTQAGGKTPSACWKS